MRRITALVLALLMCAGGAATMRADDDSEMLKAGMAKVDITPPVGITMCGYGEWPAEGIHDPLFANVLMLTDGKTSLALVSADLAWFFSERIVKEAKEKWNLDHVILCGTHSHAGPTPGPGRTPWASVMEEKVVAAIGEAAQHLFPARIGAAQAKVDGEYFAYNRRVVKDGQLTMMWSNPGRNPTPGPIDPTVRVIRVEDTGGNTRVLAAHFAAHAVVLGSGNRQISADFPGAAVAHIEGRLGERSMGMFLQGGAGDTHPFECGVSGDRGFEVVRKTGESLAENALRAAKEVSFSQGKPSIVVKESILKIPCRDTKKGIAEMRVMAVVINNDIALATIFGEPFVELQLDLVKRSPYKNTFLLGYAFTGTDDLDDLVVSYIPTVEAVKIGGYGATIHAHLEPEAGEKMIDEAVSLLETLHKSAVQQPAE